MKLNDNGELILTAGEIEVFNYVKANGGKVAIKDIAEATGRTERSIGANVTGLAGGAKLKDYALVGRDKVAVDGEEKPVTYVVLTEAGKGFTPAE